MSSEKIDAWYSLLGSRTYLAVVPRDMYDTIERCCMDTVLHSNLGTNGARYYLFKVLHNRFGPAIIYAHAESCSSSYHWAGKLHRDGGHAAIIYDCGAYARREWLVHGKAFRPGGLPVRVTWLNGTCEAMWETESGVKKVKCRYADL